MYPCVSGTITGNSYSLSIETMASRKTIKPSSGKSFSGCLPGFVSGLFSQGFDPVHWLHWLPRENKLLKKKVFIRCFYRVGPEKSLST